MLFTEKTQLNMGSATCTLVPITNLQNSGRFSLCSTHSPLLGRLPCHTIVSIKIELRVHVRNNGGLLVLQRREVLQRPAERPMMRRREVHKDDPDKKGYLVPILVLTLIKKNRYFSSVKLQNCAGLFSEMTDSA